MRIEALGHHHPTADERIGPTSRLAGQFSDRKLRVQQFKKTVYLSRSS